MVFNDLRNTDTATLMYTSGTTGEPKGIIFSQKILCLKDFAEQLLCLKSAIQIYFLAYLPLYHTFGRWLELMGSIFWGATYAFMEILLQNYDCKYEFSSSFCVYKHSQKVDTALRIISSKLMLKQILMKNILTKLEYYRRKFKMGTVCCRLFAIRSISVFQKNNIQLMSGFGMTEATGGITMTPPGKYIPNSLGKALPGIKKN